jgi:hypothetical protein
MGSDSPPAWSVCSALGEQAASLEITSRGKEIVGAGQQQVRFVWAIVGAFRSQLESALSP